MTNMNATRYIGANEIEKIEVNIGQGNVIGPYVVIGQPPQDKGHYAEEEVMPSRPGPIIIGDNNVIRAFVTIDRPLDTVTRIGDGCFIMTKAHIPHDAQIGDNVVLANSVDMGGFTQVHDGANLGLGTVVHQYSIIGAYSMVGMGSVVTKDVPPFVKTYRGFIKGLNTIGMARAGFSREEVRQVAHYYMGKHDHVVSDSIGRELLRFHDARHKRDEHRPRNIMEWDAEALVNLTVY